MKRSLLVVPVLAAALVAPALPASAAPEPAPATPAAVQTQAQAQVALDQINARIAELQELPDAQVPQVNYGQEIAKLMSTAFELRGVVESVVAGKPVPFDFASLPARIGLFLTTSRTIITATTQLTTKVDTAHIELGFCITRAVLRTINPTSTTAMLAESKADVLATLERVSSYPDLKPTDRATIYVKDRLNSKIWQIRIARDRLLLGKNPAGYRATNRALTHAVGVWFDSTATVATVDAEIARLDAAFQAALPKA